MRAFDLREIIIQTAKEGGYLPYGTGFLACNDLDGSEARRILEAAGFEVISNMDTGRNGVAKTKDGIVLSTNGYCHILPQELRTK